MFVSAFLHTVKKMPEPFLGGKVDYLISCASLLMFIAVLDVAGWGAGSGVMVRSGGNMGVYYDQVFSHAEFLVLTALS